MVTNRPLCIYKPSTKLPGKRFCTSFLNFVRGRYQITVVLYCIVLGCAELQFNMDRKHQRPQSKDIRQITTPQHGMLILLNFLILRYCLRSVEDSSIYSHSGTWFHTFCSMGLYFLRLYFSQAVKTILFNHGLV